MSPHKLFGKRRGTTAMEFALWLPVLFILVSAVIDWGYYMSQRVNVSRATMDGCRVGAAIFEPTKMAPGTISTVRAKTRTIQVLAGLGMPCASGCTVSANYCADGSGGICGNPPFDSLVVSVQYDYTPFFGFVSVPTVIDEDFLMAVENQR